MTDRAELIARIRQILPTRPSWTLAEYEQAVIAALEAKPSAAKPRAERLAALIAERDALLAEDEEASRNLIESARSAQDKP